MMEKAALLLAVGVAFPAMLTVVLLKFRLLEICNERCKKDDVLFVIGMEKRLI